MSNKLPDAVDAADSWTTVLVTRSQRKMLTEASVAVVILSISIPILAQDSNSDPCRKPLK